MRLRPTNTYFPLKPVAKLPQGGKVSTPAATEPEVSVNTTVAPRKLKLLKRVLREVGRKEEVKVE